MSAAMPSSLEGLDLEVGNAHRGEAGPSKETQTQSSLPKDGTLEQQISNLRLNLQAAVDQRNNFQRKASKLGEAYRKEVEEKETYKQKTAELQKQVTSLKEQRDASSQNLREVQAKLDLSVADLRKAQLSTFKQSQAGWFVEEDSKVRDSLLQLYKDVRSWAKKYSITSFIDFPKLTNQAWNDLGAAVRRVASFDSAAALLSFKHPFLILAGLLSDYINDLIFRSPFYIFYSIKNASEGNDNVRALEDLLRRLHHSDVSEANIWRAQLFKIIFHEPEGHELQVGNGFSTKHLNSLLKFVAEKFVYGPASKFLREMGDEEEHQCRTELLSIVQRAAKIHSRLLTQRAAFDWQRLHESLNQIFDVRSPLLAADRLHKLDDDEDESCNGKKVKVVVSPVVSVFGDGNGENLQSSRAILKAVVFLED
ncbi:Kinesin heavy chain [Neofusicoccum parvum]|nr:Kinesin heavy chain [Neofusicoccum parvum]